MFNQYDSFKNIEEKDLQEKINFNKQKSININIIEKIKVIFDEFKNNPNENIQNILVYIDNLFQNIRINIKLDFNDITNTTQINESIIEKINKDIQKIQNELQIEKKNSLNIMNKENKKLELGVKILKENENENNEGVGLTPNKKEKKFTGKKRTRERKIINNHTQIIEINEEPTDQKIKKTNTKKKTKRKKVNNKENENKNSNKVNQREEKDLNKKTNKNKNTNTNNRQTRKSKKDQTKTNRNNKKSQSKNKNIKNNKTNTSINVKNNENKSTNLKEIKSPSKRKSNISHSSNSKSPNKTDEFLKNTRKIVKIMEQIQKITSECESKSKDKDKDKNKDKDTEIENKIIKPKQYRTNKPKKKNKKNMNFIIDEELKKSTPIRNLKKQPKSILKKTTIINTFNLNSPQPKIQYRSKSSDKKVTFSSESKEKDKKFKTFSEIFQSPSKLRATPLKRKINSEKKSSHKKNNILLIENNNEDKNDFIGKKRRISFINERIVKEYNPKTPVRDVKQRSTRKSPLERKKEITN